MRINANADEASTGMKVDRGGEASCMRRRAIALALAMMLAVACSDPQPPSMPVAAPASAVAATASTGDATASTGDAKASTGDATAYPLQGDDALAAVPVEHELATDLASVWIDHEFVRLDPTLRNQRRFTRGWHRPRMVRQVPVIEATGRVSVIELPIVEIAPRRIALDVRPINAPKVLPKQVLRVLFNGHELGRYVLAWEGETLDIEVPEDVQQIGLNRLRFEPLYWTSPAAAGASTDDRPVSFELNELRVSGGASEDSRPAPSMRLHPEGVAQDPGAIFAWHLQAPDDARLRATLAWRGDPTPDGRLRVVLKTPGGEPVTIVDTALSALAANAADSVIDLDLSQHAGEFLGIHAAVSSSSSGQVVWQAAKVTGTRLSRSLDASALSDRFDVLVLLFDTLRADHLEPYGNDVVETPNLAALAETGFTFGEAGSNASWTRPSTASIWSGLHASAHRVDAVQANVPEGLPWLPEILSRAGWRTVGVSNNANFSAAFGFARGFDVLHEYYGERARIVREALSAEDQAEELWSRFLAPVFDVPDDRPAFALVHEIDPHSPYQAPEPFGSLYDFGYEGNLEGWDVENLGQGMRMISVVNDGGGWLGEADRRSMRAGYMAEVSFVDAYVGALLARLRESGRLDRTLVVMTSDHGEQFFEHGGWGHGRSVYHEEVEVPLIFSLPGVIPAGGRSSAPVQLVDLAPTVLDLLGVEAPPGLQGRSLLPDMLAGPAPDAAPDLLFAQSNRVFEGLRGRSRVSVLQDSVRLGRFKLVRTTTSQARRPTYDYELYDLERDPDEVLDLWSTRPIEGWTLMQMLQRKLASDAALHFEASSNEGVDPEVLENLRGLGYVE